MILLIEGREDSSNHIAQQRHNRKVVFNETKLGVQADIFIDMARCIMRLRSKDRSNLKDSLEDTYQILLIELGTLGQVGGTSKVIKLKNVGSALGCRSNNFRRLYLIKVPHHQRTTKASHYPCT